MPYSFPSNIPRPAKNWSESEQKKCIAAANAVLGDDGSEQSAIFACIRAAGKTEHPGGKKMSIIARLKAIAEEIMGMGEAEGEEKEREKSLQVQARDARLHGEEGKSLAILKQLDGKYRWFGWVSNHFRDRDHPAEIISGKAHEEYVSWADEQGIYPELWLWHTPGSKIGKADWLEFADGFLVASGLFDSEEVAEKMAAFPDPLTMSHGFRRLKHDPESVITDQYRMLECSATPSGVEANPWTMLKTHEEVDMSLSKAKRDFLLKFIPEGKIQSIENDTDALRKAAETAGVDWKAFEDVPDAEPNPAQDKAVDVAQLAEALSESLGLKALSETLVSFKAQLDTLPTLVTRIEALETQVKSAKATDDEKVAAALTPKAVDGFMWMAKAASVSKENITEEGDPAAESRPFLQKASEEAAAAAMRAIGVSA